jgi:hypothetical protein
VYGAVRLMQGPRLAIEVEVRVKGAGGARLRTDAQAQPLVVAQAPGESHRQAAIHLAELVQYNLAVRAYLLKEDFQAFCRYLSPYWVGEFLER